MAAGGGSATLRSPEPVNPNWAPGVLVKGDRNIQEAISVAEGLGFRVDVEVSGTETRLMIAPDPARAAAIEQLSDAALSQGWPGRASQGIDQVGTPETETRRDHEHD